MKNLKLKNNAGLNKSVGRKLMFPPVLLSNQTTSESWFENRRMQNNIVLPEILVLSSFPPRECGIATYSEDLITALNKK